MAGIGGILQILQQQQALEIRKEERHEDLAFRLLALETGKVERVQGILLKEYYNKMDEVKKTEAIFDKYRNLSPSDVSQGGRDVISIVDKQNNIDMEAITSNLNTLGTYQSQLETSLGQLEGQAQTLKELQADFAGANRVLEPHEYEAFQAHALKALDEGGLGWETTAGADVEYYKKDPTAISLQAYQVTERMQKEAQTGAQGSYAILQATFTPGQDEDTDDLIERLSYEDASGKIIEPSEEVVSAIQRMALQPDYDDFVTNLNAYPASAGGDQIRNFLAGNPSTAMVYHNLKQDVDAIDTLDRELSGVNQSDLTTDLEHFTSGISGITDKNLLFQLYDQAVEGKDPALHDQFFNAIEGQLGMEDAGMEYMTYKGIAPTDKSDAELNQIEYEQDFGDFQLEVLGEEAIGELAKERTPFPEYHYYLKARLGESDYFPETAAENLNVSLGKLDKIARMTDLQSELYQTYLNNKAEE